VFIVRIIQQQIDEELKMDKDVQYPIAKDSREGMILEYGVLRDEVLKRIEIRHQMVSIALTIAGVLLGFGLTNPTVALIYPLIAASLAAGWAQNDIRIRQIGIYVREKLEGELGLGWEAHTFGKRYETRVGILPLVMLAPSGTFIFTQIIAIGIGVSQFTSTPVEWMLLFVDVVGVIFTFVLSNRVRRELR